MSDPIHIISLGAGVQSSTMFLMALRGELEPKPTAAVFADTQDEPMAVYKWLDVLEIEGDMNNVPIYKVTAGRLRDRVVKDLDRYGKSFFIPTYSVRGYGRRQCTDKFKLRPLKRMIREIASGANVITWIGISLDESLRMKPSREKWQTHRWPLIEKRMSRSDCVRWLKSNGFVEPPKSACTYCPFKDDDRWRQSMENESEREEIVSLDRILNAKGEFLHRSLKPIDQVDFSKPLFEQVNLFNNECEGMCGV